MTRKFFQFGQPGRPLGVQSVPALRDRASAIRAELREAKALAAESAQLDDVPCALEACGGVIEALLGQAKEALERLEARRAAAGDFYRLIQARYRVFRRPAAPEWSDTVLVVMVFWLLEGGMAGAVLISDGRTDVPAGIAYGLIFAAVNILLGLLIGFLPLRYLSYRDPADVLGGEREEDRSAALTRRLSAFGLIVGLSAEAVLIFGAARLRALGTHEGVFDFEDVGFWATFDDSLAILVVVLGVCSVCLAVLKGYRGLDDPIPGYLDAYRQATSEFDAAADEIATEAEEAIEDACDAAMEDAEAVLEEAREEHEGRAARFADIARSIDQFNDSVCAVRDQAQAKAGSRRKLASFVTATVRNAPEHAGPGVFESLILPGIERELEDLRSASAAGTAPAQSAIAGLKATRARCLAELSAVLTAFQGSAPDLDALFEEGD